MADSVQHDPGAPGDPSLPAAPPVPATRDDEIPSTRVSSAQLAAILRTVALVAGAGLLLWLFSEVVLLLFFAVLLACTLRGGADGLSRLTRLPAGLMLAAISLLLLALVVGGFWWIGPQLVQQGADLGGKV